MRGKTIILGISGGIAVYKAAALSSKLVQAGADVRVIMTEAATRFVQPMTFQTLTRRPVATDTFDERDAAVVQHIDLADAADLFVVAPATANIIGKMARGIADDMLSTTYLATTAPVLLAPAMNVHMYEHPAVQENLAILKRRGVTVFEPGVGQLACGYTGRGRMAEPEQLFDKIFEMLSGGNDGLAAVAAAAAPAAEKPMRGMRVLVTAGGTVERIDPVRYLTNDSSGKMGIAFAEAARDWGAEVTLICGRMEVPPPEGVTVVKAESAEAMHDAVLERFDGTDLVVKAAAVADYRPVEQAAQKIKKNDARLILTLEKTPDILQALGQRKKTQFVIGFAAETGQLEEGATDKARRKNCDLVVGNDVTEAGAGFGTDTNKVIVADQGGVVESLPLLSKRETAERVLRLALARMAQSRDGGRT